MAGDSEQIGQDEIEQLLKQAQAAAGGGHSAQPTPTPPQPEVQTLGQDDIEALLRGAGSAATAPSAAPASKVQAATPKVAVAPPPFRSQPASRHSVGDDAALLLAQAEQALASVENPVDPAISGISPFQFPDLTGSPASSEKATLDLLRDVELDLRIELGRTEMYLEDVLKLRRGAVVTLDKLAGDPVDIFVNGRLVARGEVLVLNDNFCVRIAELLTGSEAA